MKKHWMKALIALLVTAALLAPAAVAEGLVSVDAAQEPIDTGTVETYAEQTVVLGGDGPLTGLAAPPRNSEGKAPDQVNGASLAVKPAKLTIPVNGCATVTLTCKLNTDLDYKWSEEGIIAVGFGEAWRKNKMEMCIYGLKEGTDQISIISEEYGVAVSITVTVRAAEAGDTTLSVSPAEVTVRAGDTTSSAVRFSLMEGGIDCQSSDPDVVDAAFGNLHGNEIPIYILGRKRGSATITITNDQNEDIAEIHVKVTKGTKKVYPGKGEQDGKQKCRALLIGVTDWEMPSMRMAGSVKLMREMLKTVKGPKGRAWVVTEEYNPTNIGAANRIYDTFKEADEDDLSLLFVSTHGVDEGEDEYAGAIGMATNSLIKMGELAELLKAVPGKIIIVIDACGSGAGVFETQTEQNALRKAAEALDQAAVEAFALEDTCVADDILQTSANVGEAVANPGELRVPDKFYVLTSARFLESSIGSENLDYNYFVKWLVNGVGKKGRMKADKDKDGVATLYELYKYISYVGDDVGFDFGEDHLYYQHVQMYPKNSTFGVFRRK